MYLDFNMSEHNIFQLTTKLVNNKKCYFWISGVNYSKYLCTATILVEINEKSKIKDNETDVSL